MSNMKNKELIKKACLFSGRAYINDYGYLSIGFDFSGPDVYEGQVMNINEGRLQLRKKVKPIHDEIKCLVNRTLNQAEIDSLTTLVFFCGMYNFKHSQLLKIINSGGNCSDVKLKHFLDTMPKAMTKEAKCSVEWAYEDFMEACGCPVNQWKRKLKRFVGIKR